MDTQTTEPVRIARQWCARIAVAALVLGAAQAFPRDVRAGTTTATAAKQLDTAGFTNVPFIRSKSGDLVLFVHGRLQVDGYLFDRPSENLPHDSLLLRRARIELAGWVGSGFFNVAGDFASSPPAAADPAAQNWIATTDDFVGYAPLGDWVIGQIGQFDAPFTFENRSSDKSFDFIERRIAIRAFGAPTNKEVGAMIHGIHPKKFFYYSLGAFNGDGQNFRNVDNSVDVIGRGWVAPCALLSCGALERIHVGGSFWAGKRGATALGQNAMTTQGGYAFFNPKWTSGTTPMELHPHGNVDKWAFELNAPFTRTLGLRYEYVHMTENLDADDISSTADKTLGTDRLVGHAMYVEAWAWVIGNDAIIGDNAIQLPRRVKETDENPQWGLMLAATYERLNEHVTTNAPKLKDPTVGETQVDTLEFGANLWYSYRYRVSVNGLLNYLSGDAPGVKSAVTKNGNSDVEKELIFRFATAI